MAATPTIRSLLHRHGDNVSNLLSLLAIYFLAAGLGFITNVALADHLGPTGFGRLSYALAIGMVCMTLILFGMGRTFVRELVHFPERTRDLVYGALTVRTSILVITLLTVVVLRRLLNLGLAETLIVSATALAGLNLQGLYDAWGRIRLHATYFLLQRSSYFAVVWIVLLLTPHSLTLLHLGAALLASALIGLGLQYRWALPRVGHPRGVRLRESSAFLLRSNVWVWLGALGGLSFVNLNQILLKHFHGEAALGGFAACLLLVNLASLFLAQITRVGAPGAARCTRPQTPVGERRAFLGKYLLAVVAASLIPAAPCILAPHRILSLFFTPEYGGVAETLRLLGFYIVAVGVALVSTQFLVAMRLERAFFYLVASSGLISLLSSLWLIPRFSDYGAALSLLVVHSLTIVASLVLVLRNLKTPSKTTTTEAT